MLDHMFEYMELGWIADLDGDAACVAVEEVRDRLQAVEAEQFFLAAHWVALHDGDALEDERRARGEPAKGALPGMERARPAGAHGTPRVAEFAAMELGALLGVHWISAQNLMRDAVNVIHRHPRLAEALRTGGARVWQARKVAQLCASADLDRDQAAWVDAVTTPYLTSLPWARFEKLVEAKIIEADPAATEERRRTAATARFVRRGRHSEHGLLTLVARADAGDVIVFVAMVDRIAQILAERGDTDSIDVRRSKAIGILATPLRAVAMLLEAAQDAAAHPTSDAPGDPGSAVARRGPRESATVPAETRGPSRGAAVGNGREGDDDVPAPGTGGVPQSPQSPSGCEDPDLLSGLDLDPADPAHDAPGSAGGTTGGLCPTCSGTGHTADAADGGIFAVSGQYIRPGPFLDVLRSIDAATLLPPAVLYLHAHADTVSRTSTVNRPGTAAAHPDDGTVARMEGVGPITREQLVEFLGHTHVRPVKVLDIPGQTPVDGYEIPDRLREAMHLMHPACAAPYAVNLTRRKDGDHVIPFSQRKGQTGLHNLAPLTRLPHRAKTHGRWRLVQNGPGSWTWRSPHGYLYRVDNTGTHRLGKSSGPERRDPDKAGAEEH